MSASEPNGAPAIETVYAALGRGGASFYSFDGARSWTSTRAGGPAQLAVLGNWKDFLSDHAGDRNIKRVSQSVVLSTPFPDLLGIVGRFAVRLKPDAGIRAGMAQNRDKPLVQSLLDHGVGAVLEHGALAGDRDLDMGVTLRHAYGSLVVDTAGAPAIDDVVAHLHEIIEVTAERIRAWLASTGRPREPLDANVGTDKPREIDPGAADLEEARARLLERAPRRFLRGPEPPTEDAVIGGFGKSYADARGWQAEFPPSGTEELARHAGVPARTLVSVLARTDDGRPVRLAHAFRPIWGPREGEFHDVHQEARDLALVELSPGEAAALAAHEVDGILIGPYLLVEATRTRGEITAAGLDEVYSRAGELVGWASGAAAG